MRKPGKNRSAGLLHFAGQTVECRLGKTGITTRKREGDKATPAGSYKILFGYFRKDRIKQPQCDIHFEEIRPDDGWCDDICSPNYNQPVKLPLRQSHEQMNRDDRLYDVCIVLDYNIHPVKRMAGSAIFFHLTSKEMRPTLGCIAVDPEHMRRLLPLLSRDTIVTINP